MSRKAKLLGGGSLPAMINAGHNRKTVTKSTPEGLITAPIRKGGPSVYRIED